MVASDPAALANAALCSVIVISLMFYQRGEAHHRPGVSIIAYLMVLAYASIPMRLAFGLYVDAHWLVVIANIFVCAAVLWARGNVARLIDILGNE